MTKKIKQLIRDYPELAQVFAPMTFQHTPEFQAVAWAILRKQPSVWC